MLILGAAVYITQTSKYLSEKRRLEMAARLGESRTARGG
jgi:hypothetical protein